MDIREVEGVEGIGRESRFRVGVHAEGRCRGKSEKVNLKKEGSTIPPLQ